MKKLIVPCLLVIIILLLVVIIMMSFKEDNTGNTESTNTNNYISEQDAFDITFNAENGTIVKSFRERD